MNYSYNDIHFNKKRNSKQNFNENINNIYNKRTFNKKKNNLYIKSKQWVCTNCSNINNNDYLYCRICKNNKEGELKRVKTPNNNKKNKIKYKQNESSDSSNNNVKAFENNGFLIKDGLNCLISTEEFRKK